MSFHCEVVVSVYLRKELADSVLPEVRWHCGLGPRPDDLMFPDEQLFGAADVSYVPGGDVTLLAEKPARRGPDLGRFRAPLHAG